MNSSVNETTPSPVSDANLDSFIPDANMTPSYCVRMTKEEANRTSRRKTSEELKRLDLDIYKKSMEIAETEKRESSISKIESWTKMATMLSDFFNLDTTSQKAKMLDLFSDIDRYQSEMFQMRQENNRLEKENRDLDDEREELSTQCDEYIADLEEKEKELSVKEKELDAKKKEIDQITKENMEKENRLIELKNQKEAQSLAYLIHINKYYKDVCYFKRQRIMFAVLSVILMISSIYFGISMYKGCRKWEDHVEMAFPFLAKSNNKNIDDDGGEYKLIIKVILSVILTFIEQLSIGILWVLRNIISTSIDMFVVALILINSVFYGLNLLIRYLFSLVGIVLPF